MMELQGAIGIAQLAKLDFMISQQKTHKNRIKETVNTISGVSFRELVDDKGDTATFLAFMLSDRDHCNRVNNYLSENGLGAINFSVNSWHYYPKWEHLLSGKTLAKSGWPFASHQGKRRVIYDPDVLPQSAAIMDRTLVYPISVKMDEDKLKMMCDVLRGAAKV